MILIVGSLSGFGPLCIDMYLPALPHIGDDLHASASAVQLSITSVLIGLALGQLIVGPISDRLGRRRPLFFGLSTFVVASVALAFAPNIESLIALRFLQGFGGAAGLVVSQAIVRDQYSGTAAARFFSLLMLVMGAGPILAPQIGAEVLHLGSWRIIFIVLAVIGAALIVTAILLLPETLAPEDRNAGGLRTSLQSMKVVATDRNFLANAISCGFALGAIFAYIAGAAFALENVYGLSPQTFSLVFALNAIGLIAASQINARIVTRFGAARILIIGLAALSITGVTLLVLVALDVGGLTGVLVCMFALLTSLGFIAPNANALSLNDFPQSAGSAAALLGLMQFIIGAGLAPLVGLGGDHDVLPMAIVLAGCALFASFIRAVLLPRRHRGVGSPPIEDETPSGVVPVLIADPMGAEIVAPTH
jgi:DHA1 family bicyclomycin/chloramphenicol resistance-like MFS transporter